MGTIEIFILLIGAHWLADYPLQGDFLARAKADFASGGMRVYHLVAHAGIHGAAVLLVTGSVVLALIEWVLHTLIDEAKNRGVTTYAQDQTLHIVCKVGYVAAISWGVV